MLIEKIEVFMIKESTLQNAKEAANLALLLWTGHTLEELIQEMKQLISQSDSKVFLSLSRQ